MDTQVFEYVTSNNGTVHLVPQDDPTITLCGRIVGKWYGSLSGIVEEWVMGDETLSGIVGDETLSGICATCPICSNCR